MEQAVVWDPEVWYQEVLDLAVSVVEDMDQVGRQKLEIGPMCHGFSVSSFILIVLSSLAFYVFYFLCQFSDFFVAPLSSSLVFHCQSCP